MINFGTRHPLHEENGADGGGNGAGADKTQGLTLADLEGFKASLLGEFDKKINGAVGGLKKDVDKKFKDFKPVVDQLHSEDADLGGADQQKVGDDKDKKDFSNTETTVLKRQVATMQKQLKDQDERTQQREALVAQKEQDSEARAALSTITWLDGASDVAFDQFRKLVKRDDDGNYYVGDGTPLKEAAKTFAESMPFLLPPKAVGGSGAKAQNGTNGQKSYKLGDYDPNWAPEKKKDFGQALLDGRVTE